MTVRSSASVVSGLALAQVLLWCSSPWAEEPGQLERAAVKFLTSDRGVNVTGTFLNVLSDAAVTGATSPWLGIEVESAGEALRAQLELPQGQGLIITQVAEDGPAAAKLARHDILLSFNDRPLSKPEDLDLRLAESAQKPVRIAFCRAGKIQAVEITPASRPVTVQFVDVNATLPQTSFWIGVQLAPVDDTLRAQLKLPEKEGLVVLEVLDPPHSPAAQAGVQPHDLVLQINERRLSAVEELSEELQRIGEHAARLQLLRAGQPVTVTVTPAKRVRADAAINYADLTLMLKADPASPPDRQTLIRRIYLDITGLPPSPEELEQLARDESPDVAAQLVERLLTEPQRRSQFAKRWTELMARQAASAAPTDATLNWKIVHDLGSVFVSVPFTLIRVEEKKDAAPSISAQVQQLSEELSRLQALAAKLQEAVDKPAAGELPAEKKD